MGKIKSLLKDRRLSKDKPVHQSIMLRWAFANTIFCFVTFTIFAVLIYQITLTTYMHEEKAGIMQAVDTVDKALQVSERPLSLSNLHNYVSFSAAGSAHPNAVGAGHDAQAPAELNSMLGHRRVFYIFDNDKRLLYSTGTRTLGLTDAPDNESVEHQGRRPWLVVERAVISQKTGQKIGYIQASYDISFYRKIERRLLLTLAILEIFVLLLSQVIGYYMAQRFLKPLEKLHQAMRKMARTPEEDFAPIEIKSHDEIEDLADVYNELMQKTHRYINQQKRFVSDVSHELRTPLAVLDGHINLLNRWGKNDPEILDESLAASHEEIGRMKSMLEEMLALSRFENVELDPSKMDTDLLKICQTVLKNFQLVHEDFSIHLENQLTGSTRAKIYENHYEQGLLILLDNAAKYSPDERKSITVRLAEDEEYLITSVIDQGIGISQEDLAHVFERFFRADKARNRQIGGTGLGLSIISQLAQNYHGKVEVTSELGSGSTFILKLPKI